MQIGSLLSVDWDRNPENDSEVSDMGNSGNDCGSNKVGEVTWV